jgi:hypothetical protein
MSTIKATTLSTQSNATVPIDTVVNGTAKAWVNFNGTGTVAIRASFNVASITDNGVGDYTVNFTTAMPDANYSVVTSSSGGSTTNPATLPPFLQTTASFALRSFQGANTVFDQGFAYAAIFR